MQEENYHSNDERKITDQPMRFEGTNKEVPTDRFVYVAYICRIIEPKGCKELEEIQNLNEKGKCLEATKE